MRDIISQHDTEAMDIPSVIESNGVEVSERLAALAEPIRLRIVSVLSRGECCVCTLQEQVTLPGNLLSYHLRVLREAGLVAVSRRGRWMDYRLDNVGFECLWRDMVMAGLPLPSASLLG